MQAEKTTSRGRTRIIALTGGIASGKNTVGELVARRGYLVIDSDRIARELTQAGSPVLAEIVGEFGDDVLGSDGSLDRGKVAGLVFSDEERLRALERILHPRIVEEYRRRIRESDADWVFVLIPLLFEAGREEGVDRIWLCYAPMEVRLERAMARDGASREDVLARMRMQIPDEEKRARADVIIDTSGTMADVERQVEKALAELEGGG
jgi:dephospho-CoA kinase